MESSYLRLEEVCIKREQKEEQVRELVFYNEINHGEADALLDLLKLKTKFDPGKTQICLPKKVQL